MQQIKVKIEGHVQGVFFRATTRELAQELNLRGWVANRSDGSVEATFEGEDESLGQMLLFCLKGPDRADVKRVTYQSAASEKLPETFEIKR